MKNILKGFIIGIGKIIPGFSGALLAILLGVYDKSIDYIVNFKYNKKESIKYLAPLGIGIILSIIIFSKIINYTLNKYYFITLMLFIGLIIGTIPEIINKTEKKDNYLTIISFIIFFLISISNINNNYIPNNNYIDTLIYILSGITEAVGTVFPGVSSSALLMIEGTYNIVIEVISNITNINQIIINIKILLPFILGLIIGIIGSIKLIDYLLKKYNNKVYSVILGITLSSIILLIISSMKYKVTITNLIIGLLTLIIGITISTIFKEK